ncbi:cyclin-B2-4-like [Forsythia ovata]|uniref:Cyclin-B2-4-like n=1 Tax=Forsythia ovata TaxID=205694 RepID=A0ABD1TRS0_9LAMI
MGGSDENFPGVIRPSNILGILRDGGDKFPTPVGHSRRALNAINKNIIGNPPYPSAVHKRGVLTKKNAISNKKPDVPVHRPITSCGLESEARNGNPWMHASTPMNRSEIFIIQCYHDREGKLIPVSVKEGDTVLLPEYGGTEVKLGEKE